ncbi:hypothetical protein CAEBREN_28547 [Caenorhabditis brenneri]|uniref:Serpentine Receptor, class H n=1 Tax=Caenorhabditis brenneri TaxID=135651 RepID=G0N8P1_CAEBE|nr:hypothetical protein CAEBREN_28547 [Caenorhabditis brenneri]
MNSFISSNCPSHSYYDSAVFHQIFSYSLSLITAPINFYGVYLIMFKSDKALKNAKWVMLNSQIWSTLVSLLLTTFLLPFLVLPIVGGRALGVLTHLGVPHIFQVFIGFGSIAQIGSSMVIVFENQQNHVVTNGMKLKSKWSRNVFAVFNKVIGFTFVIPIIMQLPNQEIAKRNVLRKMQCPPPEFFNMDIFILAEDSSLISWVVSLMLSFYIFEAAFCILHCGYHLIVKTRKLSNRTRALQKKFFIVVCIQIFTPFSIIGLPICYLVFSVSTGHHNQRNSQQYFNEPDESTLFFEHYLHDYIT